MSKINFSNITEIIKHDLKASFSNPIVILVLVAIIILPSLYALLNIQACWDPYENTDEVEFAIANLDNGSTFEGTYLNVGNEIVKDLKNNTKFDWKFVTEEELRKGVHDGDYYAGIIIPKNLSENIASITSDNPKQAKLEYLVNIKSNPVATKLTDSGANTVYTTVNAKIVQIINLAAYGKLGELQDGLSAGAGQLYSGGSQLSAGASQISAGAGQVSSGVSEVQNGASQVQNGANQVQQGSSAINQGASDVEKGSSSIKESASTLEHGSQEIQSKVDPSTLPDPMKEYVEGNIKLANGSGELAKGSSQLADGSVKLANSSSKLANGASAVAGGANQLAGGSVELAEGSLSLAAGAQMLSSSASQALFSAAGALSSSANSLSSVTGINESELGDYFYSPIKLDRHELFPVPDYGSDVAPFYIVLSMWVGAIITCVMITPGTSQGTKYTPLEMYFGKVVLFIIMSILQAAVTIGGAYLLGIHIANSPLFIFSAVLVSVIFMILVYSIISALGQVGKGIGVILLVLQISGTGGIYPIEIMHSFFQTLYPYLPMTYAITLIREAQLGVVWSNYIPALTILISIGIITIIVASIIKQKADKSSKYFEERLKESGLF
ncbi:MAG: YhgE/Pip family protein [Methanobrevibacter sp.]|uniref:YhgE/Pip family protein n=1 Tax=Methanobrevibacter sp. TaxID=66852 RepID=UPI003F052189